MLTFKMQSEGQTNYIILSFLSHRVRLIYDPAKLIQLYTAKQLQLQSLSSYTKINKDGLTPFPSGSKSHWCFQAVIKHLSALRVLTQYSTQLFYMMKEKNLIALVLHQTFKIIQGSPPISFFAWIHLSWAFIYCKTNEKGEKDFADSRTYPQIHPQSGARKTFNNSDTL